MEQQKQRYVATNAGSESTEKRKVTVGSVWLSRCCGEFEVIEYMGCNDITIMFTETGFTTKSRTHTVRSGQVKDRMAKSIFGVGFIGDGEHSMRSNGEATMAYLVWRDMIRRCYSEKQQEKQPAYKGCTVCEEWHNFQNFAEWYYENFPNDGGDYQLDKDLKLIGNKVYSPETCIFVSSQVNKFTIDCRSRRGEYMIGADLHKHSRRFRSRCSNPITGKVESLGYYDDEVSAHLAWRKRKSEIAYELSEANCNDDVRQALLRWRNALNSNLIHSY